VGADDNADMVGFLPKEPSVAHIPIQSDAYTDAIKREANLLYDGVIDTL
jgi:hypothetical protein